MGELLKLPCTAFVVLALLSGVVTGQEKKAAAAEPAADASGDSAKAAPPEGAGDAARVKPLDLWILNFRFQKLAMMQPTEGVHRGDFYWYMIYQIENATKADRSAYISVTARSNKNKTYANMYVPDLESAIERKAGKPLWGKTDLREAASKKDAKGADPNYTVFKDREARDCVAIFNKLDPLATKITIQIDGLSNDVRLVERENASPQIESRVYVLEFERPGDEYEMNLDQFRLVHSYWMKKVTDSASAKDTAKDGEKARSK